MFLKLLTNPSVLVTKLLSFTLIFGWYFGCLPQNINKSNQKQKKNPLAKILIFLSNSILIIFYPILFVCSIKVSPIVENALSDYIIIYIPAILWISVNSLRRLCFLLYFPELNILFQHLKELEKITMNYYQQQRIEMEQHLWKRFPMLILALYFIVSAVPSYGAFLYLNVITYKENKVWEYFNKDYKPLIVVIDLLSVFCGNASKYLSLGFTILIGLHLLEYYYKIVLEFVYDGQPAIIEECTVNQNNGNFILVKALCRENNKNDSAASPVNVEFNGQCRAHIEVRHDINKVPPIKKLVKQFQLIQLCFTIYNKAVGLLLLFTLVDSSLLYVTSLYKAFKNPDGKEAVWAYIRLSGSFEHFLLFYLTAYVGQLIKETMEKAKEIIRKSILVPPASANQQETGIGSERIKYFNIMENKWKIAVANYMIDWEWNLTAADLFSVDYKLFPMFAGTMMTYIMFMFQLKISEETLGFSVRNG